MLFRSLPLFNLYAAPLLFLFSWITLALFFLGSLIITAIFYRIWWGEAEKASNFIVIWGSKSGGNSRLFLKDTTIAGWVHFLLMTCQLIIVGTYIFSPMPAERVQEIFWLFTAFILLAIIQPGIAAEWPHLSKKGIMESLVAASFVWGLLGLITYHKLYGLF